MKNKKYINIIFLIYLVIMSENIYSNNQQSRFSEKELKKMESKALKGDFKASMTIVDYQLIDLQDSDTDIFWTCICFENNKSKGSWNFAYLNYMENENSLRYQYLIFLSEEFMIQNSTKEWLEIKKEWYADFHKKFPDFKSSDDNLKFNDVTEENYQYFCDKAFSGSGLAALKLAHFYENQTDKNVYDAYKRLLDIGCKYNPDEENLPIFWLRIGAQNGNKECMRKYAEFLRKSSDKYDNIRAEFWEKKSKE